jgi:hypothetical protein
MATVKGRDDLHISSNDHVEDDGNNSDDRPDTELSCELQPIRFDERVQKDGFIKPDKSRPGRCQGRHIDTLRQALVTLLTTSR